MDFSDETWLQGAAEHSKRQAHEKRIFNRIMVVAASAAGFDKAEALVKSQGRVVGGAEFENQLGNSRGAKFSDQGGKELPGQATALEFESN